MSIFRQNFLIKSALFLSLTALGSFRGQARADVVGLPVPTGTPFPGLPEWKPAPVTPIVKLPFIPSRMYDCEKFRLLIVITFVGRFEQCRVLLLTDPAKHTACLNRVEKDLDIALQQVNLCFEYIANKNNPK